MGDVNFSAAELITHAQTDELSPSISLLDALKEPTASSLLHILNPEPVHAPTSSAISTTSLPDRSVAYTADDEISLPPTSLATASTAASVSETDSAHTRDDDHLSISSESSSSLQIGTECMDWEAPDDSMNVDGGSVSSGKSSKSSLKGVMAWFASKDKGVELEKPAADMPAKKGAFGWTIVKSGKRKNSELNGGSDSSDGSGRRSLKETLTKKVKAVTLTSARPAGNSRSAQASRKLRASVVDGTFQLNPRRFNNWKAKILVMDEKATYDTEFANSARHFPCGEWIPGKEPYDATRFGDHVKICSKAKAATGMFTVICQGRD